jgi:pyruvate/2-oxoglutarate dehydrogenase complex dihydrolipoamide acyltransferase (E2) component
MTLHFTSVHPDVVSAGSLEDTILDILTFGDKPVSYDLQPKAARRIKLSITFDGSRVDDLQAATFLRQLQTYLSDPDTMLL